MSRNTQYNEHAAFQGKCNLPCFQILHDAFSQFAVIIADLIVFFLCTQAWIGKLAFQCGTTLLQISHEPIIFHQCGLHLFQTRQCTQTCKCNHGPSCHRLYPKALLSNTCSNFQFDFVESNTSVLCRNFLDATSHLSLDLTVCFKATCSC